MDRGWKHRAGEWVEGRLRRICGAMSPSVRLSVIIVLFLLFAALSAYCTASVLCGLGCGDGERLRTGHLERLELRRGGSRAENFGESNTNDYERESKTAE